MKKLIVTTSEEHSTNPTEFGISFTGINPEAKDYFKMADEETAIRLKKYLNNIFNINSFDKAVEPAIRYLLENHNPHTKIYIDYSNAELLSGEKNHNLNNEIPD